MKTSLEHLPPNKQSELLQIASIIKDVVTAEKIILFGSYATGKWVEDKYNEGGIVYEYRSDYDLLVVTSSTEEKEYIITDKIVNRTRHLFHTPLNVIVHDMDYVNEGLRMGQYFFTDIIKEGILLYDADRSLFAEPKLLTSAEQKKIAEEYFQEWFKSGEDFLHLTEVCLEEKRLKIGAFQAHQAAERFYNTILLVFTGYKPKTHSLDKLRQHVKLCNEKVFVIYPDTGDDKQDHNLFDLLKRGYIDARYKPEYTISEDELQCLIEFLQHLKSTVNMECVHKLATFK